MAALMFAVPEETFRVLKELEVPEGTPEPNGHITVVHLGDDIPVGRIAEILPTLYDLTSRAIPFSASTNHVTTFPAGKNGVPVIAEVESWDLHEFRGEMCRTFDLEGIEYSKKFPTYKPHVTLTYAEDPDTECDLTFPGISWPCHELLLWGANRGTGKLVIKLPLSFPGSRVASKQHTLYSAALQLAKWGHPTL